MARQLGGDAVDVVWRNGRGPLHGRRGVAGHRQPAHGTPAAVARDQAGLQVPVPQSQRCGGDGERQQGLAFTHLHLVALAVGDVVHREQPAGLAIKLGGAHGLQHGAPGTIAHVQRHFVVAEVAGLADLLHQALAVFGGEDAQLHCGAANGFLAGNAQHVDPGGVEVHIAAIAAVRQAHGVGHEMEDAREALLGLAQALLGTLGFVDVLHHAAHPDHAAVLDHRLAPGAHPKRWPSA